MDAKVYKLSNTVNKDFYVGSSSLELPLRLACHKCKARTDTSKLYRTMRQTGIENWYIEEISKCHVKDKEIVEQICITLFNPSLNMKRSYLGIPLDGDYFKNYYQMNKQKAREYYLKNREKYKQYYLDNKERICQYNKQRYRETH